MKALTNERYRADVLDDPKEADFLPMTVEPEDLPVWTDAAGQDHILSEISDRYLLNILRHLKRNTPDIAMRCRSHADEFASHCRGDGATMAADDAVRELYELTDEEVVLSTYDEVFQEAEARGLVPNDDWPCLDWSW